MDGKNERERSVDRGNVPAWNELKGVPFLGAIGKKIDEAYVRHEVARNNYNGGGDVFWGTGKVNESGDLDVETELQEEISLERYRKIGRMILDLPVIRQVLALDRQRSINNRNQERMHAYASLDSKRRQAELEAEEAKRIKQENEESEKKTRWIQKNKKNVEDAIGVYGFRVEEDYFPGNQEERDEEFSRKTNEWVEKGILSEEEQFIAAAEIARNRRDALTTLEQQHARRREEVERMLNDGLTTIDELEEAAMTGEYGVTKSEITYGDKKLEIIDSGDMEMKFLHHQIDFDGNNSGFRKEFEEHPEIWDKSIDDIDDHLSSELCLQYVDQGINPISVRGLSFGFSRIRPTSLKYFGVGRAVGGGYHLVSTRRQEAERDVMLRSIDTGDTHEIHSLDDIAERTASGNIYLNEFVLDRYDEIGRQPRPDYIISSGEISEAMKKHADYFGIPIVIIHDKKK